MLSQKSPSLSPRQRTQEKPAAELLSEHCFAENALRAMCLTRGCLGALLASRGCFPGVLCTSPASTIRHASRFKRLDISGEIIFTATGRAPAAPESFRVHVNGGRILLAVGICQFRAGNHPKMTRATASSQFGATAASAGKARSGITL